MGNFTEAMKQHDGGVILDLFVTPNAGVAVFPTGYNSWRKRIETKVASAAKDNKANKELIKIAATFFQTNEKNVSIVHGDKVREKSIFIKHASVEEIVHKLRESLNGL